MPSASLWCTIPEKGRCLSHIAIIAIGLPVYNGALFVGPAIRSILAQTFRDIELIISDNGSSDDTADICQRFATQDSRIRYIRHGINRGAAWNFNHVFEISHSPYFKWAACDDVYRPEFLQQCYTALQADPHSALATTATDYIDEHGRVRGSHDRKATFSSSSISRRFREAACVGHSCLDIFGLMRRPVLARTRGLGAFASSDRVLLAELAMQGRFIEFPEPLFLRRDHSNTSVRLYPDVYCRSAWFDPSRAGRVSFPSWRMLREYVAAIVNSPVTLPERLCCSLQLVPWLWKKKRALISDVLISLHSLLTGNRSIYTLDRKVPDLDEEELDREAAAL
ncbi:glycosyltransferase family 2 protein [soil metagenome]